ncbi:MAG: hypothetical protein SFZ03_08150 [Candidatus Melainabacteria bacterium]|nr:hypothetical protein [Candidatus Melainabacteria bacterium]
MSIRNVLILFFSALAVALVILIICFSLFFEHLNISFNTHAPESAPDFIASPNDNDNAAEGDSHSLGGRANVNVPGDSPPPVHSPQAKDSHSAEALQEPDVPFVGVGEEEPPLPPIPLPETIDSTPPVPHGGAGDAPTPPAQGATGVSSGKHSATNSASTAPSPKNISLPPSAPRREDALPSAPSPVPPNAFSKPTPPPPPAAYAPDGTGNDPEPVE